MSAQMHHTPLDLARQHGHGTVVEVLESKAMKEVIDDEVFVLVYMLQYVMLYRYMYTAAVHVLCTVCCLNIVYILLT